MMAKIPQKFMGLLGKFADSLDYNDLPKNWADNPEVVQAAEELYRDMGTESPFFKAWFGKSKVVDDAGNPMAVYHGSGSDFDTFKRSKMGTFGPAIYTTPDKKAAFEYAGGHDGNHVYELFVKSDNPFTVNSSLDSKNFWDVTTGEKDEERIKDFLSKGYDSAIAKGYGNSVFGKTSPEIASYYPSSVKSTANRGTFNPNDPNIYKAIPWAVGGTAAALSPGEAQAAQASESPDGGSSWQDVIMNMARGFSLGTRNVLEGLGRGATLGSGNPGGVVSDWMGLARPETEAERLRGSIIEGISGAVPMSAGGMGVARMAAGPVARGVGRDLSSTPGQDALLGGLLGYFGWGD